MNHAYIMMTGPSVPVNQLSPAEKYDLLVGDMSFGLTQAMWSEGDKARDMMTGQVEPWMGICHGWAAAAYMFPRPRHAVDVVAADGQTIRFYPDDIKALASLLWANAPPSLRFVGTRCDVRDPQRDANGRILPESCFDTNPGTFHLAIVNQIGVDRRAFIMDATYDYEVWNQPVYGYEYRYFNPATRRAADSLSEATVQRSSMANDIFAPYRSPDCVYLVGIAMRTSYMMETYPDQSTSDGPNNDVRHTVDYHYDLELDGSGRIIGGEWYQTAHPDFLWTAAPGARAATAADARLREIWRAGLPVPASYSAAAMRASPSGLPLARVVEHLVELANG
jgi:hypothetical protein